MLPAQPQEPEDDTGYKNEPVRLTSEELLANIRAIQAENNIHQSERLVRDLGCCSLDVEMETGTGKTYVYIKTMFELNKRYGWSKFIVVVPSIAIREGVKNIKVPCMALSGTDDEGSPWVIKEGVDLIPGCEWTLIQGAPHICSITHPEETCAAVEGFISRFE